jgi:hypothetical protein
VIARDAALITALVTTVSSTVVAIQTQKVENTKFRMADNLRSLASGAGQITRLAMNTEASTSQPEEPAGTG